MTLQEAIVVRISHDLAGGIGAVVSTTELMEIDPSFSVEAGGMLKKNGLMLMARLRFYRALFGAETKEINASIVDDYLKTWGQDIRLEGVIENRLQLSLVAVGIILLAEGGALTVKGNKITLKGPTISAKPEFIACLEGKKNSFSPETVEAEWLMQQLSLKKNSLKFQFKPSSAQLEII